MRKLVPILLLFITLSAAGYYYFSEGGSTTTLPASSVSRTVQWRSLGTDSLRQMWRNDGLGWNRVFTATEANFYFLTKTNTAVVTGKSMSGATNTFTAIPNSALVNSTISGKALGTSLSTLTLNGTLVFNSGTTYDGSNARILNVNTATNFNWTGLHTYSSTPRFTAVANGAAGTDSLLVKKSDNLIYKVASSYYASQASVDAITASNVVEVSGTSQTMQAGKVYVPHNTGTTALLLPSTASVGAIITIVGECGGTGTYNVTQNASQYIRSVSGSTTTGTGGYLQGTSPDNVIVIRCTIANTKWTISAQQGTFNRL